MNKTYQTIWNESLGAYIATPEATSARGKKSKAKKALTAAITLALSALGAGAHAQIGRAHV